MHPSQIARFLFCFVGFFATLSCNKSPSAPSQVAPEYEAPPSISGMVLLNSGGRTFFLGSDDAMANPLEEKPRMPVTFHYHFAMDSLEVTQSQWKKYMGSNPDAKLKPGIGDSLPVYHVSWYDAVLFCNARSIAYGLDTVYSYVSIKRDAKGNARDLVGLSVHYDRLGFRLPTEAEWQWAASEGGVTDRPWHGETPSSHAWYGANSGGQVYAVGSKGANRFRLHDMLGNVMEWTQDWKVGFRSASMTDFVGGSGPGVLEEKVVKGGCYLSDLSQLRPGSRSTVYPITAASVVDYIGFRCVIGRIDKPKYLTKEGKEESSFEPLRLLVSDLKSEFGYDALRIALVRVNSEQERILQVIDIQQNRLSVRELMTTQPVFAPTLSPDGRWVAFSSTGEGMSRQGMVRVVSADLKDTASIWSWNGVTLPRWYVDTATRDTFLIAASSGIDNTQPEFGAGTTYKWLMRGGASVGEVAILTSGAYHDGLSPRGDFLASGYRQLRVKELASGNESVLFTSRNNGKRNEDTAQACNVSWRPRDDDSSQILFLDFGTTDSSSLVGRPYGIHEIAFLIDARGTVLSHFAVPPGYAAFADLEWSNRSQYAVSVLEDSDRRPVSLAVSDVNRGITIPIVAGSGLMQPSLFMGKASDLNQGFEEGLIDSLFRYEEPFVHIIQGGFARKVRTLFTQAENIEAVIVGSSHFEYCLVSDSILNGKTVNLSLSHTWHSTSDLLLRQYVLPHAPKLKAVVFNLLPGIFAKEVVEPLLQSAILSSKGYQFDKRHDFWVNGFPNGFKELTISLPQSKWFETDSMGNFFTPSRGWGVEPLPLESWVGPSLDPLQIQGHIEFIKQVVQNLKEKDIAILIVETPKNPGYGPKGNGYVSYMGPSVADAEKIHQMVNAVCAEHPKCAFYDAHHYGDHDYGFNEFHDHDHLSRAGGEKLSVRIDSVLTKLLAR